MKNNILLFLSIIALTTAHSVFSMTPQNLLKNVHLVNMTYDYTVEVTWGPHKEHKQIIAPGGFIPFDLTKYNTISIRNNTYYSYPRDINLKLQISQIKYEMPRRPNQRPILEITQINTGLLGGADWDIKVSWRSYENVERSAK